MSDDGTAERLGRLDDQLQLVFTSGRGDGTPCEHLAWVDGRYTQWERTERGADRVIGSTEFRWDHPASGGEEGTRDLMPYLQELRETGPGWAFAPAEPFAILRLSAEETAKDGRIHLVLRRMA